MSRPPDGVASGETITIAERGVLVATLAPPPAAQHSDPGAAMGALRQFQQETRLTTAGVSIREMVEEGRR